MKNKGFGKWFVTVVEGKEYSSKKFSLLDESYKVYYGDLSDVDDYYIALVLEGDREAIDLALTWCNTPFEDEFDEFYSGGVEELSGEVVEYLEWLLEEANYGQ